MRSPGPSAFWSLVSAFAWCSWTLATPAAQERLEVDAVIARIAEGVAAYYQRAQRLICTERSTVIPIDSRWNLEGFGRTVESELRVETDGLDGEAVPEARVSRAVRRVNGREPREADRKGRSGCTDPAPLSPEPLAFVLPTNRDDYVFTSVRRASELDRAALVIDFASAGRRVTPELIEDAYGHDDCFDWKGALPVRGRLWVDATTYDVLRLERHLAGPTDVSIPALLQRRYGFPSWLTIDRDDVSLTYGEIKFTEPEEVLLLPVSMDAVTILRSGLQSTRRTQVFSDYRRFLTGSRIKKDRQVSPSRHE